MEGPPKKKKKSCCWLSPAPCSRCLGSLSNFRASRPSARPSVLVVGLFNPRLHALLLLVPVTAEADFHDAFRSVCFCEFLRSKSDNLLPEEARPRLSRSLNTRTSSLYLSLSEHTHTLRLSLSLLPLSVEGRMFRMATLAWEFGRRRGCVYVCVKRKCRGWGWISACKGEDAPCSSVRHPQPPLKQNNKQSVNSQAADRGVGLVNRSHTFNGQPRSCAVIGSVTPAPVRKRG